ncbi:hypothetical protein LZD49_02800 [Dyadobacter sp. CY261]|uniref:hypothetical protein n=1 Tax=Dyadobacter sp. CY261 TaxID=2907203 RepID=UPI001F31776F|nr:hypothetical protein [Dyadobacter sp. CY261]MCF0069381.1 hypothetical protein [Dyadobacter sp. CY261]
MSKGIFKVKDEDSLTVEFSGDEIDEIVPDADMRFSLVILRNGEKHFVEGTEQEIRDALSDL